MFAMITDEGDVVVPGEVTSSSNVEADSPLSPDGSRTLSKLGRSSPYPTVEPGASSAEMPVPPGGLSNEDQEKLDTSVNDQMTKLANHLDIRLNADRHQIQQEQVQANQVLVDQLIVMQQDANAMRNENLVLRKDLHQVFTSLREQTQNLRDDVGKMQALSTQRDEYAPEIQMSDPVISSRKNLLRPEYRSGIYPPPQTNSIPSNVRKQVMYTQMEETRNETPISEIPFAENVPFRSTANWKMRKIPPLLNWR